uniref:DNA-directed RNA polymerase subunit 1 n=1 Tax=Borely moumouvirus TaxID=2712067 RepID=A0A6G6AAB3_9VIRU
MTTIYIEEIKDGKLVYRIIELSNCLASRIKGRHGRIKSNQMGKKGKYMGTLITGNPLVNIEDIIPENLFINKK